jgi:hypothetical protein
MLEDEERHVSGASFRSAVIGAGLCVAFGWGCAPAGGGKRGVDHVVEFVYERQGGLCPTPDGGGELCRLRVEVLDDGTWTAVGAPAPAGSGLAVRPGAASELAVIFDEGWEALTAGPFIGICPAAYDGSEVAYSVRRIPAGPDAALADADVREARSCTHDFTHPRAKAVLDQLQVLWRELGLPE